MMKPKTWYHPQYPEKQLLFIGTLQRIYSEEHPKIQKKTLLAVLI